MSPQLALSLLLLAAAVPPAAAQRDTIAIDAAEGTLLGFDISPDGSTIAIDLLGQLWLMPAAGGSARAITDAVRDTAFDLDPSFAPSGDALAFVAERAGRRGLWLLPPDSAAPHLLLELPDPESMIGAAAWSPDGRNLAIVRVLPPDSADAERHPRLAIVDLATRVARDVTVHGAAREFSGVAWTPDGRRLVFFAPADDAERGAPYRLWSVDTGGGVATALGTGHARALAPVVAPDGRRVAYLADDSAGRLQVWLHEAAPRTDRASASPAPRRLTSHADVSATRVRWSSDGLSLYYVADGRLRRMDLASGTAAEIPFTAHLEIVRERPPLPPVRFPEPGATTRARGFTGLALSPDATRIAMLALGKLWLVPVGDTARAVTEVPLTARHLSWAPDGEEVAWAAGPFESEDVYATNLRTGATRRVTALPGREILPAYSPDGRHLAFVHVIGETSLLRVASARGTAADTAAAPAIATGHADWTGAVHLPLLWSPASDAVLQMAEPSLDAPATGLLARLDGDTTHIPLPDPPIFSAWVGDTLYYVRHDRLWAAPLSRTGAGEPQAFGKPRPLGEAAAMYLSAARDGSLLFVSGDGLRLRAPSGAERTLGWPLSYTPPAAPPLIVRNVRIIDGTGAPATEPRDLLIERGRISRIAPAESVHVSGAEVLDARGAWVIPGLMDLHAHTYVPELLPGFAAFGVTLVRDQGSAMAPLAAWRDAIAAGIVPGPRVTYGAFQFYTDWPFDNEQGRGIEPEADSAHVARALDLAAAFGADHVKTRTFRRWDIVTRIVTEAHRRGMRTTGHCVLPLPLVAAGIDAKEHVGACSVRGSAGYFGDIVQYGDADALMQAAGIAVVPTVSYFSLAARLAAAPHLLEADTAVVRFIPGMESFGWMLALDSTGREEFERSTRAARAAAARLAARGVVLGTGTDIWQLPTGVHLELEELVAAGLSPAAAIRAATGDAARIIGAEQEIGTIAVGRRADLVILDADPLADIRNTRRIRAVLRDGRVVDPGQVLLARPHHMP